MVKNYELRECLDCSHVSFGVFDFHIAKYELSKLYNLTVLLRYFAAIFMVGLWILGEVEIMILLFADLDAAGASWTLLAIKSTIPNES